MSNVGTFFLFSSVPTNSINGKSILYSCFNSSCICFLFFKGLYCSSADNGITLNLFSGIFRSFIQSFFVLSDTHIMTLVLFFINLSDDLHVRLVSLVCISGNSIGVKSWTVSTFLIFLLNTNGVT